MIPFPKGKQERQQLFSEVKEQLPEILDLIDTFKNQGYTPRLSYFKDESGKEYGDPEDLGTEFWQVDDALVQRVEAMNRPIKPKGKRK